MNRLLRLVAGILLGSGVAQAQLAPPAPASREIVIATSAALTPVLEQLVRSFAREQNGQQIRVVALGSDVAMAWLSSGRADIAVLGREATEPEVKAYEWVFRRPPAAVPVMRGSLATPGHSPRLAVLVNDMNPLTSVSFEQLQAAFRVGGPAPTWRELGASGPLGEKVVGLILPDIESGTGRHLRKIIANGATQLDWSRVREVTAPDDGAVGDGIAALAAADPAALAIGDARPKPGTHVVAVSGTPKQVRAFDRTVVAYAHPEPRARAKALLAYLRDGASQLLVARDPYRPLEPVEYP